MTQAPTITGTHVKFFRDGDAFSVPIAGTADDSHAPGDEDGGWIDFGPIVDTGCEFLSESKDVFGAKPNGGKLVLHDVVETKIGFARSFIAQELSPFIIERLYGTGSLDELSEDYEALSGITCRGWLLAHRYDQGDVLIAREKAFVHLKIDGAVSFAAELVTIPFKSVQLFDRTGQALLTQQSSFLLTQTGFPILV
jgi:hypothetical protein